MKLLLADDDADQLELRSLTLSQAGHQVYAACDVDTALKMAAEHRPEAAVVDLRLPTQNLGLDLIRGLKQFNSQLRIIVLSGVDPKQFEKLPERALVEAVFTKGGGSRLLLAYLQSAILP
jgi:DNA-binding response OmpR family regulator